MQIREKTSEVIKVLKQASNAMEDIFDIVNIQDINAGTLILARIGNDFTLRIYVLDNSLLIACAPLNKLSNFSESDRAIILETALRLASLNFDEFMGGFKLYKDRDDIEYQLIIPDYKYINYECVNKLELYKIISSSILESISLATIYVDYKTTGEELTQIIKKKFGE